MPNAPPTSAELDRKRRPQRYKYRHVKGGLRLYNQPVWRRLRLVHIGREPLCRMCRATGRATMATVVDHIIPHDGDMEKFLDPKNLQSLCKKHHDQKTMTTDRLHRT